MHTVIGIDPGWSGGVAVLGGPEEQATGFSGMTEHDILETVNECCMFADVCFIEKVHSMPKQGVASSFKFGHIYGFLRAAVQSRRIPLREVSPVKWQRTLGCLSKGNKNVTKSAAQQRYPKLKITHATADAILIATYGRQVMEAGK